MPPDRVGQSEASEPRFEYRSVVRLPGSRAIAGEPFGRRLDAEQDAKRWTRVPFNAKPKHIHIERREVGAWEDVT